MTLVHIGVYVSMNYCKPLLGGCVSCVLSLGLVTSASHAISLTAIDSTVVDPADTLINNFLAPSSGLTVTGGQAFIGSIGDGSAPNSSQSALFTDLNLVPNNSGLPTISQSPGILLTTGTSNIPSTNTDTSFSPFIPGTGGDADLNQVLINASAPSSVTNDVNSLSFNFTVDDINNNSVSAKFVFGSDEFPDQAVTDVFGFFVDGTNFAFFPDGSLVSFVQGANAGNFNDNDFGTNNYDFEYDGISNSLLVTALLDPTLTDHTFKVAIADTDDSIFDSGIFLSDLSAGFTTGGGGIGTPTTEIPEPSSILGSVLFLSAGGVISYKRRKRKLQLGSHQN